MTLSCERVFVLLSEYMDDELSPDVRAAFEAHVKDCTKCAQFGKDFSEVVEVLRSTQRPAMPDALQARLQALLES